MNRRKVCLNWRIARVSLYPPYPLARTNARLGAALVASVPELTQLTQLTHLAPTNGERAP